MNRQQTYFSGYFDADEHLADSKTYTVPSRLIRNLSQLGRYAPINAFRSALEKRRQRQP